jgi:hypothetical protein
LHLPFKHGSGPGSVRFSDPSVVALVMSNITTSDLRRGRSDFGQEHRVEWQIAQLRENAQVAG